MIGLAGPIFGLFLLITESDPLEQALWERVQIEDAIPIYELYLQLFPRGAHAHDVWELWFDRTHRGDPNVLPTLPVHTEEEV